MSERASREPRAAFRSRANSLNAALPPEYLEQLEQKRKQLDESIHKYIAAKEREYKTFEKELHQEHKQAQGQGKEVSGSVHRSRASSHLSHDGEETAQLEAERSSAADKLLAKINAADGDTGEVRQAKGSADGGTKDIGRDKDFVGLFTPPYLRALAVKDGRQLERSSSAPPELKAENQSPSFERANSDSVVQAPAKRPSHLTLAHRNSSSGSSAEGKLASALKSPTQRGKRKRVSLAVGDEIVAPSDSVPMALGHYTAPSHSRVRASMPERASPVSAKRDSPQEDDEELVIEASLQKAEMGAVANAVTFSEAEAIVASPKSGRRMSPTSSPKPSASSTISADGDLFDLEDELDPLPPEAEVEDSDDSENALETDDENLPVRMDGDLRADEEHNELNPELERYDSTDGLIPIPAHGKDSAVPHEAFGPSSVDLAQQPMSPGFRRPSVVRDPVYKGTNYNAAEQHVLDTDVMVHGSSFDRPTHRGSFTAGSLGESFMLKHAKEMKKTRSEAKVRA